MSPNNKTESSYDKPAQLSLSVGITLYSVGVGQTAEEELKFTASEPQQEHVYYAEDFSQMEQIADKLKTQIHSCEGTIACVSVMYVISS